MDDIISLYHLAFTTPTTFSLFVLWYPDRLSCLNSFDNNVTMATVVLTARTGRPAETNLAARILCYFILWCDCVTPGDSAHRSL